jgi:methionyl-tRNA formyltransferase
MRVVFFGTPDFAVPTLDALLAAGHDVRAVVTQPDRPRTRSHSTLIPSPVKQRALAAGIAVLQPERPRGAEFLDKIASLDCDLGVVVAYGHILRPDLLAIPRLGMVNVHASILPRWRGAAPIHWAILSGDWETGVSIMTVEEGLDSGPVWHVVRTPIEANTTTGELFDRLANLGAQALIDALPRLTDGTTPTPQDPELVTLAPKIDRDVARINWNQPAHQVSCRIRAMDPAPGAWTTLDGQPYKLFSPAVVAASLAAGELRTRDDELIVGCGEGALRIADIQPAGRRRMPVDEWLRGVTGASGLRFV